MTKKNVLFISEVNEFGGAEITFIKFIKDFLTVYNSKYDFHLLTSSKNVELMNLANRTFVEHDIKILHYPFKTYFGRSPQAIVDIPAIFNLISLMKKINPDIVVINQPGGERGIQLLIPLLFLSKKTLIISFLHIPHSLKFCTTRKIGFYGMREFITKIFF